MRLTHFSTRPSTPTTGGGRTPECPPYGGHADEAERGELDQKMPVVRGRLRRVFREVAVDRQELVTRRRVRRELDRRVIPGAHNLGDHSRVVTIAARVVVELHDVSDGQLTTVRVTDRYSELRMLP